MPLSTLGRGSGRFPGLWGGLYRPLLPWSSRDSLGATEAQNPASGLPMMAKPKPPLRLVLPTFQVARLITKATKDDATVTIPLHEVRALVAAAAK